MKYPKFTREQNLACKLSGEDIACIRWEFSMGATKASLARKFKVSEPAIRYWVDEVFRQSQLKRPNTYKATPKSRRVIYYRKMEMYEKSFKLWIAQERKRLSPRYEEYQKKYQAKYYLENIDKIKEYCKKNKVKKREYMRNWQADNRDKVRVANKKSYEKNKEKRVEYNRLWAEKNKEWMRDYQKEYYKKYKNIRKADRK